jgi:Tautomerase enzyme
VTIFGANVLADTPGGPLTNIRHVSIIVLENESQRSDDLVIIQITWNEGRTVEQKEALYKAIVDGLAAKPGIRPEDCLHQPCRGQEGELVVRQWCRAASAEKSAKIVKSAQLKVYPGAPHGLAQTHADTFNADVLAFIKA